MLPRTGKKQLLDGAASVFEGGGSAVEGMASEAQVDLLYRQIGRLKVENDFFGTKARQMNGTACGRAYGSGAAGIAAVPVAGGVTLFGLSPANRGQQGGRRHHASMWAKASISRGTGLLTIDHDTPKVMATTGLSMAARAHPIRSDRSGGSLDWRNRYRCRRFLYRLRLLRLRPHRRVAWWLGLSRLSSHVETP